MIPLAAILSGTYQPIAKLRPMVQPSQRQLAKVRRLAQDISVQTATRPILKRATVIRLNRTAIKIFTQIVAVPLTSKTCFFKGRIRGTNTHGHYKLQVSETDNSENPSVSRDYYNAEADLGDGKIDGQLADTIAHTIAKLAASYRQWRAACDLIEANPALKLDGPLLKPHHPAAILTDLAFVGAEFIDNMMPSVNDGDIILPWTELATGQASGKASGQASGQAPDNSARSRTATTLSLTIDLPYVIMETLADSRLADLIALDDKILAKLPPHAREAWNEIRIEKAAPNSNMTMIQGLNPSIYPKNVITLTLQPARQILWFKGALPHDMQLDQKLDQKLDKLDHKRNHTDKDGIQQRIDQAILNLAISGEVV